MRLPTVSELLVSLSFLLPARRRPAADPRPRRARPSVEPLEGRAVPTANLGWAFQIGSTTTDNGFSTATDAAGDVYVTGSITGASVNFDPNGGTTTLTPPAGTAMGYIAKYSAAKSLLWVIPASATIHSVVYYSAADAAGDIYAVELIGNASNYQLAKYDPNGNLIWSIGLNQTIASNAAPMGIALDSAGNPYVTGRQGAGVFVARFSGTSGALGWNKQVTTSVSFGSYPAIAIDSSGNVYCAGDYSGKVDFDPGPGTYYLTSYKGAICDAFVLELNSSGNFVWAGSVGTDNQTQAWGVAVDGSGNVSFMGIYDAGTKSDDFDPGPGVYALPGSGTYVLKLNASHQFQWADSIAGAYPQVSPSVRAIDPSGNVYLAGSFSGSIDFDPGPGQYVLSSPNVTSPFVLKLDAAGNFVWAAAVGTVSSRANGISVDPLGDVYAVGNFTGTTNFDPNGTYTLTSSGYNPSGGTNNPDTFVWQLTQSSPQLAAGGAKTVHPSTTVLTDAQLRPIVAEARRRWLAAGADPARLARLTVQVADLGGAWLGATSGTRSRIDATAAGYGWFVDPMPADDSEFTTPGDHGQRGHMDLLTVVMHELGLGLGLSDGGPGLMQRALSTGTRRLPTAALLGGPSPSDADLLFALLSDPATHNRLTGHLAG